MKKLICIKSIFICMFVILLNCGGPASNLKIIEESSSKEDWVKSTEDYFEKDGKMYFKTMVMDRKDLSIALRQAKGEAVKNIAEKINIRVRTEFESATRGSNINSQELTNFTSDVVAWVSDNVNIQGFSTNKTYWQKIEITNLDQAEYLYNVYLLSEIPSTDYIRARNNAINDILKKYQDQGKNSAEKTAEEVKKRLLQK